MRIHRLMPGVRRFLLAVLAVGLPLTFSEPAHKYDFSIRVFGPGEENLSVKDPYARYQWALKNDGELQYVEIKNRFEDSNPELAAHIDMANKLGLPAPVSGPDAYKQAKITARKGVDINVLPAWNQYDASTEPRRPVTVAVIDTGVDVSHPDLQGSIWVNEDEIPDDGIDNDQNGFVDDVNGWNFFDNSNQIYTGKEDTHGTHAAGTIAATRKGTGIAGIADNQYVKLMVLKALGTEFGVGEEEDVINAIRYAEANGAEICNLSFGTTHYYPELEKVMRESKMLFIVAAGNGDKDGKGIDIDANPDYPSCFGLDNVISVANLIFDGNLEQTSNYGINNVDIAAPGTYIVSTTADNSYGFMTGTSMAAPMVTGAAAFLYSYRTDIALTDVRRILMETARKLPGLEGKIQCGGVVNVYNAVNYGK